MNFSLYFDELNSNLFDFSKISGSERSKKNSI